MPTASSRWRSSPVVSPSSTRRASVRCAGARRVTDRRQLLRLELAALALGATVLLTTVVIGVDALRFHRTAVGAPLASILVLGCLALGLMGASLVRQVLRQ